MLAKIMNNNKFTLVVSLPKNDLAYAKAAAEAGADAIKVHINAFHYASNQKYGSLSEQKEFLENFISIVKSHGILGGIVPGDDGDYATSEELVKLHEMGFDFASTYVHVAPVSLISNKRLDVCAALNAHSLVNAKGLEQIGVDIVEASVVAQEQYRKPLSLQDIGLYAEIVSETSKPVLVPTQKKIKPEEIEVLYKLGCKGIMIGAVVFDQDNLESFKTTVAAFRNAINQLV